MEPIQSERKEEVVVPKEKFFSKLTKKIARRNVLVFGFTFLIILIAGGLVFHKYIYLAPERVLLRALVNLKDAKSFKFEGKANLFDESDKIKELSYASSFFRLSFDGKIDLNEKETPKSDILFDIDLVGFDTDQKVSLNTQLLTFGDTFYSKTKDLSGFSVFFGLPNDLVATLDNTWIRINDKEFEEKYGRGLFSDLEIPEVDQEGVANLFRSHFPFNISQLPDEEVNGLGMYHFAFELSREQLKTFLVKFNELIYKDDSKKRASEDEIEKDMKTLNISGEIWVGKSDNYPYKIIFEMTSGPDENKGRADFDITFSDFNKPVNIEEPNDYKSFEEIILGIQQSLNPAETPLAPGQPYSAFDPSQQFAEANNTIRKSDAYAILNAVYQYAVENQGLYPPGITTSAQFIGSSGADICKDLVPIYLAAMPVDPSKEVAPIFDCASSYDTGYTINRYSTPDYRITVTAPSAELGQTISITR